MLNSSQNFILIAFLTVLSYLKCDGKIEQLTSDTLNTTLASNELVFIHFYSKWNSWSNVPVFDKVAEKFPEVGKVVLGKVDCEKEITICKKLNLGEYPTLRIFRNGHPAKGKYRGELTYDAILKFVEKQMENPVKEVTNLDHISEDAVIGINFNGGNHPEYDTFRRVAANMKDSCPFYIVLDNTLPIQLDAKIVFKPDRKFSDASEIYTGNLSNFDQLLSWASQKCDILKPAIFHETTQDLNKSRLPFLILFHTPDDEESVKKFIEVIEKELLSDREDVQFLVTDPKKYVYHPLYERDEKDLPVIGIDTTKHLYVFPDWNDMAVPGKLKQFIRDLYSGKLHREYHYGPDVD